MGNHKLNCEPHQCMIYDFVSDFHIQQMCMTIYSKQKGITIIKFFQHQLLDLTVRHMGLSFEENFSQADSCTLHFTICDFSAGYWQQYKIMAYMLIFNGINNFQKFTYKACFKTVIHGKILVNRFSLIK